MVEKIVISGSMKFLNKMLEWKEKLEKQGYSVEIPTPEDFHRIRDEEGNLEKFNEIKRRETAIHFGRIKNSDICLILNYDKDGKRDYIGGNTFGEIAYAMGLKLCHGRNIKIYTVNPIPENLPYSEELIAWQIQQWQD
ncbi:MAG: hypothetical protein KKF67_00145 [Nanoarchaeota archaeon]|nr:hypothetical protein [Nanoarchaeota archaeon]